MIYGCETKPLLADVGLKFKRAEMLMIRQWRKLVGGEPITTVIGSDGIEM